MNKTFGVAVPTIIQKDDYGNIIYKKCKNGLENWWKHDSNGKIIYYKDSEGFENWMEYDSEGELSYEKHTNVEYSYCQEWWYGRDYKSRTMYTKKANDYSELFWWDLKGVLMEHRKWNEKVNIIYSKSNIIVNGYEQWYEYYEKGKIASHKDSSGNEYKYNQKGELFYQKDGFGEHWYDSMSNELSSAT